MQILGYSVKKSPKIKDKDYHLFQIEDEVNAERLGEVTTKFHHLIMSMEKPATDIYEDLDIKIPSIPEFKKHKTGIYDDQFIIFELPQIAMENQQLSLVNKTVLNPHNLERFINFLVPGTSKKLCKDVYFEKLKSLNIASIGLFGSRQEVLNMLDKFNSISKLLHEKLMDKECDDLSAGIHAILPVKLQKNDNIKKWDGTIYLFYWSLPMSFDMKRMRSVKYMRKDPSCLLSRVCHFNFFFLYFVLFLCFSDYFVYFTYFV